MKASRYFLVAVSLFTLSFSYAQDHSVARRWNEVLLDAIRIDFARPTVHARNLFHTSVAMYDAWAVYDDKASTFFLNHSFRDFYVPFSGMPALTMDKKAAQEEAISYAAYRLLKHRFGSSPGAAVSLESFDALMHELGYDTAFTSTEYTTGSPAALGNYIASMLIRFGYQDGANELNQYASRKYEPVNPPFAPSYPGDPTIVDPNRWQPLALNIFVDQSGQVVTNGAAKFLSPEWGSVVPFSLSEDDLTIYNRDGFDYWVYHDPGPPPHIDPEKGGGLSQEYMWSFALVAIWSSHLDPSDNVVIDISPASTGNITDFPTTVQSLRDFYNLYEGGDHGTGYTENPKTGLPYEPQFVPRGDYARVLAEFWADGPNSETPPGHWFTILNYVNDHPLFKKNFNGEGPELNDLEWDVKAYLTLGGAMHDVAVTAWGIKGYYDYVRPVSAIRSMATRGQCTNPALPHYHPAGIPLHEGYIELVNEDDELAGMYSENVGKIKLRAWRGPGLIQNPAVDEAGVGWILAENWWPYQRPSFVTPPFAGYISGHSTFSRAAAEVLTLLTGDEYFPGGMSEFHAGKNQFLVFEEGPGADIVLQWAKYKDASDQCSLSRIWGGIHPPADDIPGRLIGKEIGIEAFNFARTYFDGQVNDDIRDHPTHIQVFPTWTHGGDIMHINFDAAVKNTTLDLVDFSGREIYHEEIQDQPTSTVELLLTDIQPGLYIIRISGTGFTFTQRLLVLD